MEWWPFIKDVLSVAELRKRLAESEALRERQTQEITKLRGEVADLRRHEQTRQEMEMQYEQNVYWRRTKTGPTEGPFCPKCFDRDDKPVRLSDLPTGWWSCPVCNWAILKSASAWGRGSGHSKTDLDDLF
ncbi:MAG TPA: hypothetical protein VKB81_00480 [Nitrospira sp.]|nr:hypothetical protein [Nitrospira sp.]